MKKIIDRFIPVLVDEIPDDLAPNLLYISVKYREAVHLCPCGCGHIVTTPFAPDMWQLKYDGETVSLNPSIGNGNYCGSHYFISHNAVEWCWRDSSGSETRSKPKKKSIWKRLWKKHK